MGIVGRLREAYGCDELDRAARGAYIGRGAHGDVYDLTPGLVVKVTRFASGSEALRTFWNEVRMLCFLQSSGVTPLVVGARTCGDVGYIVMQRALGVPLTRYLRDSGPAGVPDAMESVARALLVLAAYGAVHGDLHADNVFVHQGRWGLEAVFVDLGSTRLSGSARAPATTNVDRLVTSIAEVVAAPATAVRRALLRGAM